MPLSALSLVIQSAPGAPPSIEVGVLLRWLVVPGVVMLLHQAAEQFTLMTGRDAPLEAMRAALGQVLT